MPTRTSSQSELDLAFFRRLLEKRQQELTEDSALGREAADRVELDQTRQGRLSRIDALQQQAMAAETQRRRTLELKRVGAALKRIEDGEYGYCLTCGEEISPARLKFDPSATQCVACAENSAADS